jgi:hypothetical protein
VLATAIRTAVLSLLALLAGCSGSAGTAPRSGPSEADGGASLDDGGVVAASQPDALGYGVADANAVVKSAGCGQALVVQPTPPTANSEARQYWVSPKGETLVGEVRGLGPAEFRVWSPLDYDPNTAYRLVYVLGDFQGNCSLDVNGPPQLPLFDDARGGRNEAIYVEVAANATKTVQDAFVPSGMSTFPCYQTDVAATSDEFEVFALVHASVEATYCVDEDRVSVVGGTLADMWSCYFAGDGVWPASDPYKPRQFARGVHLRAVVSNSNGAPTPPDLPACNGPVAAFLVENDVGPFAPEDRLRQRYLAMNGCATLPYERWHPEIDALKECFRYTGCSDDYPVVTCPSVALGDSFDAFMRFLGEVEDRR